MNTQTCTDEYTFRFVLMNMQICTDEYAVPILTYVTLVDTVYQQPASSLPSQTLYVCVSVCLCVCVCRWQGRPRPVRSARAEGRRRQGFQGGGEGIHRTARNIWTAGTGRLRWYGPVVVNPLTHRLMEHGVYVLKISVN